MSESRPPFGQTDVVYLRDEDASVRLLEGAIGGLWEVVNQLTRFRRSKRENFRVTIFGSARIQPGSPVHDAVKQLAAELTAMGCDTVTGGGPGQMQAANEGAVSVDPKALERSVGIRVELPFEHWHAVRDVAGVAAASRAEAIRHAADPGRQDVGRAGRMGPPIDAPGRPRTRQRRGFQHPALRERRRRDGRADPNPKREEWLRAQAALAESK